MPKKGSIILPSCSFLSQPFSFPVFFQMKQLPNSIFGQDRDLLCSLWRCWYGSLYARKLKIMQKKVEAPRARNPTTIYRSGCELLVSSRQGRKAVRHIVDKDHQSFTAEAHIGAFPVFSLCDDTWHALDDCGIMLTFLIVPRVLGQTRDRLIFGPFISRTFSLSPIATSAPRLQTTYTHERARKTPSNRRGSPAAGGFVSNLSATLALAPCA